MSIKYFRVTFEVFGEVQGVFFRKYTKNKAIELGLVGWCKNTTAGTVQGEMQGEKSKIDLMKDWLERTGSPQSRIDHAVFSPPTEITELMYKSFEINK